MIPRLLEGIIKRVINENTKCIIGMGISGGVDSTLILALIRKCFPNLNIKTYCVIFGENDNEAKDAQHVSELYSTDHKEVYIENPFKDLETQIRIVGEPKWNLYPYYLFREAAKECDLLLLGDGGDELFGGYVFRYEHILKNYGSKDLVQLYLEGHNRDWVPDQDKIFAFPFYWDEIYALFAQYFDNPLPPLGKVFLADYNGKLLHDFMPTNMAFSKYFKIKVIAPMLEPEVLFVATHIPYHLKYDPKNKVGKILLRQILMENSAYKPAIKSKIGWGMEISEMWEKYVRDQCMNLFSQARFLELKLINKDWISYGFKKANEHDPRYLNKMLGLLALEIWLRLKQY
ncbi:MAG: asparagine synthase-related protein [Candidatus Freyarchaeota archaeon]